MPHNQPGRVQHKLVNLGMHGAPAVLTAVAAAWAGLVLAELS